MRPATAGPTRTRVSRRIDADPTSTALLLAGPTAVDLWPGVRRVGEVDGRVLIEAELTSSAPTAAMVRAHPPKRTPTSYVTTFDAVGPDVPATDGQLTLAYAPGSHGPATMAVLTLTIHGPLSVERRGGVLSFAFKGLHPHDISQVLDQSGVCVRAGHHCAKPLMRRLGVGATARASFYVYNDTDDVDALAEALAEAASFFSF